MGKIQMTELLTTPSTPATNKRLIYPKSDGWYQKDDSGVETKLAGADALNDLTDVTLTSPSEGQYLKYTSGGQWVNTLDNGDVFGDDAAETSNNVFDSNGSSSYENYLTLVTTNNVINKKHRIGSFVIWNSSTTSNDIEIQLTADEGSGQVEIGLLKMEAKEAGTDNQVPNSGFFYYTPTTTSVTLRINYRMQNGEGTAYMFYGGLEWWRVEL